MARTDLRRDPFRLLLEDVERRVLEVSSRETEEWQHVETLEDWRTYVQPRIEALRESLGDMRRSTGPVEVQHSGRIDGNGFVIENLAFKSSPHTVVGANLYRPAEPSTDSPAILICHSHHNPKTQIELQEAGIEWARAGCVVLVPDQPGHGERRDHPFHSSRDWQGLFQVDRQDYWFRYVLEIQLQLVGTSLMGWMVRDGMRCVDLLCGREDVDPKRIVVIGSVAGGGDIAAVMAALDPRIRAAVPFGFGAARRGLGRLAPSIATEPNFAGCGGWEGTRNLRLSAKFGFFPWTIVASIAPRYVVYAHEFGWDEELDPVWPRLQKVYELHGVPDRLAVIHGTGTGSGPPPHNSHCNNVGSIHRRQLAPLLKRWFGIVSSPIGDYVPLDPRELVCLKQTVREKLDGLPIFEVAAEIADDAITSARHVRNALPSANLLAQLRHELSVRLGDVRSRSYPVCRIARRRWNRRGESVLEEIALGSAPGNIRMQLFVPGVSSRTAFPVVVAIRQEGFDRMDKRCRDWIGRLMVSGIAVCSVVTRGMGRTRQDETGYGRVSLATRVSATEWMLGRTLLASKMRDLRATLDYLATRQDLDGTRIAMLGDSGTPADSTGEDGARPMNAEPSPKIVSPIGGLLALLVSVFDENIRAVYVRGGLSAFASVLASPFCLVPHEAIIPRLMEIGDLSNVAAALAPRPLRMEALVDARNRTVDQPTLERVYHPTTEAYRIAGASANFTLVDHRASDEESTEWLRRSLADGPEGRDCT